MNTTTKTPSARRFCRNNWCFATCGFGVFFISGTYYAADGPIGEPTTNIVSDTDVTALIATLQEMVG